MHRLTGSKTNCDCEWLIEAMKPVDRELGQHYNGLGFRTETWMGCFFIRVAFLHVN